MWILSPLWYVATNVAAKLTFKIHIQEFPRGPVVRTRCFHCCGPDSIPGGDTKIPQTVQYSQKINNKIHILIFKSYFLRVTLCLYSSEVNQCLDRLSIQMNLGMDWCWYSATKLCPTLCELRKARLPCPSPSPGVFPSSSPLSRWCHPTISSFNHCPLLLLPSIFPSIRVFSMSRLFTSGGQSIGASSFSISPSNEYSELISIRIDWLDLLAIQRTLKSLLQYHSSKASILWRCAFFIQN